MKKQFRTREEIEELQKNAESSGLSIQSYVSAILSLEVLLDIRELLIDNKKN